MEQLSACSRADEERLARHLDAVQAAEAGRAEGPGRASVETLYRLLRNIVQNPSEPKYRQVGRFD